MPKGDTLLVGRTALLEHLTRARLAVARRSTIPILTHVLLRPVDGSLRVFASDLELSYSGSLALNEGDDGAGACVALESLLQAVQSFEGETISLAFGATSVKVASGKASGSLPTEKADDFPSEPPIGDAEVIATLPWNELSGILRTATRFADTDPKATSWSIGVRLLAEDRTLTALGTDIVIATRVSTAAKVEKAAALVVLASTLGKVAGVKSEGAVELALTEYHAALRSGEGWRFSFRLADLNFPDIRTTFARANQEIVRLSLGALAAAVERAASFDDRLSLSGKAGAESLELGTRANDFREEIPCVGACKLPLTYATYLRNLRPVLESGDGEVTIYREAGDGIPRMLRIVPESGGQEFMIAGI